MLNGLYRQEKNKESSQIGYTTPVSSMIWRNIFSFISRKRKKSANGTSAAIARHNIRPLRTQRLICAEHCWPRHPITTFFAVSNITS